jgi:drug/metabolite transporter (DMT)-like permease
MFAIVMSHKKIAEEDFMKAVLFAVCAVILYAAANVVLEAKLSKFSVFGILPIWYLAMLPVSLLMYGGMRLAGQPVEIPPWGSALFITMSLGVVYVFADAMFIGAYTNGGNAFVVSSVTMMFPVVVAVIKNFYARELPNRYYVLGYAFAAVAVLCITKGSQVSAALAASQK